MTPDRVSVAFVGMTHLGLCSGVAAASKGFEVTLFDADRDRIAQICDGRLPVMEPDLDALFSAHRARLTVTADPDKLGTADIVYVAPDVPTDDSGTSDLEGLRSLIASVIPHLGDHAVLVVLSQVPPGFTRSLGVVRTPLYYQVETLIFGRAMQRACEPERLIVGARDPGVPLPAALATFLAGFACPVLTMRYESAELTKISINMCLVASIGVANTMAELCEHVAADWSEIAPALKLDRRIGPYSYLTPGLGLAGGNLERDLATVISLARTHGTDGGIVEAWVANSAHRKSWAWQMVRDHVLAGHPHPRIGILGLAYKENTHSTKNSASLALLARLGQCRVRVFDPVVASTAAPIDVEGAESAMATVTEADAVVIMTPWPQFRDLVPEEMAKAMAGRILIDPFRVVDGERAAAAGLRYFTLGVSPADL